MTRAFSPAEKRALWEGWKIGLSLVEIGRGLDRQAGTILNVVRREGGFAPRPHKRSASALKAVEREEISRGLAAGCSMLCDPRSPWQRGSNENTNGLLRQYFPKGRDVSHYSQAQLNRIAHELNERPRETLNWRTPLEAIKATVASTG